MSFDLLRKSMTGFMMTSLAFNELMNLIDDNDVTRSNHWTQIF